MSFYYKLGAGSCEEHYEATLVRDDEITADQFERMVEAAEIVVVKKLRPEWIEQERIYREWHQKEFPSKDFRDDDEPHKWYGDFFDEVVDELISSNGFSKPIVAAEVWRGAWDTVYDVEACPDCGGERLRGERFGGGPLLSLPHVCKKDVPK